MNKLQDLENKKILVLGLGREGQDTLNFLKSHFPGKNIDVADKKQANNYLETINDYDVIFKTPGIPLSTPEIQAALKRGTDITSQTQLFFDLCPGIIIGVTGTKGKSTTSSLIAHVLRQGGLPVKLIGNIGTPVLSELDHATKQSIFVYELSSFQLQSVHKSPHIAVVLHVASEHLDYHKTTDEYIKAKSHIAKFQEPKNIVIYNAHSPTATSIAKLSSGRKIPYSRNDSLKLNTQLKGEFNLDNILPAIEVAKAFGISNQAIQKAIKTFQPLEHRLEYVGRYRGIDFYNDSLSTTPLSAIAAVTALGDKVETIMLGGSERYPDLTDLAKVITESKIKNVILFPDTGKKIWAKIHNNQLNHLFTDNMQTAVDYAYQHTTKGKICLMSPAAPSFSMFKDYAERGETFKKLVSKLSHDKATA